MRLHLAAHCTSQSPKWHLEQPAHSKYILESFYYLEPWLFELKDFAIDNFMLDSGAFTFLAQKPEKKIDWDEYVERYAATVVERNIKYFFELDIDPIVGLKEVERLREKLELMTNRRCIPVWHRARGRDYWLRMLDRYDYVALGGIVTKEIRGREHGIFKWFLRTAQEKGVKVHGLGYTNAKGLEKYPFYSVDSTSWVGSIYGLVYHFDGKLIRQFRRPEKHRLINGTVADRHNLREWLKYQKYAEKYL